MKDLIVLIICCFSISIVNAQLNNNPKIDFDIRIGYGIPSEANTNSGLSFGLEPRYWLGDNMSFGLKADFQDFGTNLADIGVGRFSSYMLTGDFYSSDDVADRLFGGLGLGLFKSGSVSGFFGETDSGDLNWGIMGRVGYLRQQVRISFEYNVVLNGDAFIYYGFHFAWSPF
ncbi:MAG: hypothetical protein HKN68_10235 [Saprospiraceae bacterium]|nr:hypothetical protein [Saprospiraceae bacterium]